MIKLLRTHFLPALVWLLAHVASAQQLDSTMWVTDQSVLAIARSGNAVFLGGRFTHVGPNTGGGGAVSATSGKLTAYEQVANVNGQVHAAVPDGQGGWYIGGAFRHVQGVSRYNLAHILANNALDMDWNPNAGSDSTKDGAIYALVIANGRLYVGGAFAQAGGRSRSSLAAVDLKTGRVTPWQSTVHNVNQFTPADQPGTVRKMEIRGNTLYLAGEFNQIAGQTRYNLAAIDLITALPTPWDPEVSGPVHAFVLGADRMYVGGRFRQVGPEDRNYLACVELGSARPTSWTPYVGGEVFALALYNNTVYAGIAGEWIGPARTCLVAIDAATGVVSPENVTVEGDYVKTLAVAQNTLYLGGRFYQVAGKARNNVAALELVARQPTAWAPSLSLSDVSGSRDVHVNTVAVSSGQVYIGGNFSILGGEFARNLVALDANTGRLLPWKPQAGNGITAMALVGNTLYISEEQGTVNGVGRSGLKAIDIYTGNATSWQPAWNSDLYGHIHKMVVADGKIYMSSIWGNYIGVIDLATGAVSDWKVNATNGLFDFAPDGDRMYVVGTFTEIDGQARNGVACFDLPGRRLNAWDPAANFSYWPTVRSVAVHGNQVIVGGHFQQAAGQSRTHLAAFDKNTAQMLPWAPVLKSQVIQSSNGIYKLSVHDGVLYAGGYFTLVNNQPRNNLAAFDLNTGTLTDWQPNVGGYPYAMTFYKNVTYVGGSILGPILVSGFGAFGRTFNPAANFLKGRIYEEGGEDCQPGDGEKGLAGIVVTAQPGPYFGLSDSLGNYTIAVDTGTYTVRQVLPADKSRRITPVCPSPATRTVAFSSRNNTAPGLYFGNQVTLQPYLEASVASARRRRCFPSHTTLSYCNAGTLEANGVQVHLELPPHVVLVSAGMPYTVAGDKHYVFDIGRLAAGQCGAITVTDSVVCDNPDIRGLTQCTKVWLTPANPTHPGPGWDGSDVALKARCLPNGRVRLGLYNPGKGTMADSSAYRLYLDAKLVLRRNYKLAAGDSLLLQIPANGQTVRLEADQRPGHPTRQSTNVSIEACGTNAGGQVSLGFVAQLPQDDAGPEADTECLPITDSFDPNDKLVAPAGVSGEHLTALGQELEYTVRFQNTGNDYAYRVVLVDTLSDKLDISTLRMTGASHPYRFAVSGKGRPVLTWTFNDINLPDSARDQAGSNGFVRFTILPVADQPAGTRIENFADIFFDYNPPVRTNTTLNTLHDFPREISGGDGLPLTVCTPNPPVSAGGNQAFCGPDTTTLRAERPRFGAGRWRLVGGAGRIGQPDEAVTPVRDLGQGDNVFEWSIPDGTCAGDSLRFRVTVTHYRTPGRPAISLLGVNELHSTVEGDAYQWYCNGHPLPDHSRSIRADRGGLYTVRVSGGGDCPPAFSEPFDFRLTGPVLEKLSVIYPNPAGRDFTVALPGGLSQVTISLFDAQGRKVAESTTYNAGKEALRRDFHLPACRAGVYLVKVQTPEALMVKRLVLR